MRRQHVKRETDLQIISDWIEPGNRVLDLGCGRGVLLEHLRNTKQTYGVGVDNDPAKVQSCIKRGVSVYQGEAEQMLAEFGDHAFDWVVLSRTLQDLERPAAVMEAALRVGKCLAVGFVNHAYWKNRYAIARTGSRLVNDVFPQTWDESTPSNPVTVAGFETFCRKQAWKLQRVTYLRGDWKRSCRAFPNLRAGYALYAVTR